MGASHEAFSARQVHHRCRQRACPWCLWLHRAARIPDGSLILRQPSRNSATIDVSGARTSRQEGRNTPLSLMIPQMIGFHRRHTWAASLLNDPATTSGGGAKTSGICEESTSSPSTSHRDEPPIRGDRNANTTRAIRASRIAKEHIGHGSTIV